MTHSLSDSNWKPPSVDRIVCNIDRIYAAGLFWRVVSPQLLERQSRIMSAIALMTEKLKATLPPLDQPPQERRQRRLFPTLPSPRTKRDSLIVRHKREVRLYIEAFKRAENKSTTGLDPTVANITLVYSQLAASLEFWEDAKFWFGMPWWRQPRLDFPWAPSYPSSAPDQGSPARPLLATSNDSQRLVTFCEGAKDSSPKAPAITRVPRCSIASAEFSVAHAFRPGVKLVSV